MKEYMKYNLNMFLANDSKKYTSLFLVLFVYICIFLFLSFYIKVYNTMIVDAQVFCEKECEVRFYTIPNKHLLGDFIKINNEKFEIENIRFDEVKVDSSNNVFQMVALKVKEFKGNDKEIVKLKIYQNKELIIKKIIKIVIER